VIEISKGRQQRRLFLLGANASRQHQCRPGEGRDPDPRKLSRAHACGRSSLQTTSAWGYGSRPSPGRRGWDQSRDLRSRHLRYAGVPQLCSQRTTSSFGAIALCAWNGLQRRFICRRMRGACARRHTGRSSRGSRGATCCRMTSATGRRRSRIFRTKRGAAW